ncbi:MAG TPA: DUF3459 domain-containing protein, partial [Labilithrix sp.]|nr:DUF3459 domain-containing protein [Labilithrix sp.]
VYAPTQEPRGRPATLAPEHLVYCIQNHDQVGNRAFGTRLTDSISKEAFAGATLLLLFLPAVPLLFMGQEWAATTPFLYFTDHEAELGAAVTRGRREEFKRFRAFQDPTLREQIPDPQAASTFERSKLNWSEVTRGPHAEVLSLYRNMLRLRAQDPVLATPAAVRAAAEGDLLVVTREQASARRIMLFNCSDAPLSDRRLSDSSHIVLASMRIERGVLPPWSAVLLDDHGRDRLV